MRRFQMLWVGALCLCLLSAALFSGCGAAPQAAEMAQELNVYATFYPFYAIASMLTEGVPDLRLNCLVQPQDGCLRNYSLSDWDYALLSRSADAVIAGGRGLESFESILYGMGDSGPAICEVLYNMELSEREAVNAQADSDSHWQSANPHIYMSVEGAIEIARRIAGNLAVLDPEYEARYMENLDGAERRLEALASELRAEAGESAGEKVIVMNEALLYVAMDYDLDIDLCYERESSETLEGSDLEACLEALSESEARIILIERQAPRELCDALLTAGYTLARMDVLSTRRADEGADGYFDAQRKNARALKAALSAANPEA